MCVFEMQLYGCYECNVLYCIVELYLGVLLQYVDVEIVVRYSVCCSNVWCYFIVLNNIVIFKNLLSYKFE